jgi:hypothetical protein
MGSALYVCLPSVKDKQVKGRAFVKSSGQSRHDRGGLTETGTKSK